MIHRYSNSLKKSKATLRLIAGLKNIVLMGSRLVYSLLGLSVLITACVMPGAPIPTATVRPRPSTFPKDPAQVSMNSIGIPDQNATSYSFAVVGHLYGTEQGEDREPDAALLKRIPDLMKMNLSMLVSLGDTVKHSEESDFNRLKETFLNQLAFPVFNTVGNHDVGDRSLYERMYPRTYYSFRYGPSQMIFLDTERTPCSVDEPQRTMLDKAVSQALKDDQVEQIFVFMHKTLFFKNDVLFDKKARQAGPNVWDCYGSPGFARIMDQTLLPAAEKKPLYLFAGDVGAWGNLSPYYERRSDGKVTMIMTGLGDVQNDAILLVRVNDDQVTMEVYSLNGGSIQPIQKFSPKFWEKLAGGG
jgi:hypothetical protein